MLKQLKKSLRRKGKNSRRSRRRTNSQRRPTVESLEGRRLMAADVILSNGLLSVTGSSDADDIRIDNYGTHTLVFDSG